MCDILYVEWAVFEGYTVCTVGSFWGIYCMYSGQLLRDILYVDWAVGEGYTVCRLGIF
jgi:hypothetical protein